MIPGEASDYWLNPLHLLWQDQQPPDRSLSALALLPFQGKLKWQILTIHNLHTLEFSLRGNPPYRGSLTQIVRWCRQYRRSADWSQTWVISTAERDISLMRAKSRSFSKALGINQLPPMQVTHSSARYCGASSAVMPPVGKNRTSGKDAESAFSV